MRGSLDTAAAVCPKACQPGGAETSSRQRIETRSSAWRSPCEPPALARPPPRSYLSTVVHARRCARRAVAPASPAGGRPPATPAGAAPASSRRYKTRRQVLRRVAVPAAEDVQHAERGGGGECGERGRWHPQVLRLAPLDVRAGRGCSSGRRERGGADRGWCLERGSACAVSLPAPLLQVALSRSAREPGEARSVTSQDARASAMRARISRPAATASCTAPPRADREEVLTAPSHPRAGVRHRHYADAASTTHRLPRRGVPGAEASAATGRCFLCPNQSVRLRFR